MATATSSNTAKQTRTVRTSRKRPARTYDSALKYLFSQTDYEQMLRVRYNRDTFSLDRMKTLLEHLGNPQSKFRSVHVAGTKGKGSTCMLLARMLQAGGYKVGLYSSPHICDVRERITINGDMISQAGLTRLICEVEPIIEKMDDKPTFFEIFTAMCFMHFASIEVDIAIIETGLGGRLDSTNVLMPEVCGITSISIDHVHQLGNTVDKIAAEKAGIFKPDVPVVSVMQCPEAEKVLRRHAKQVGNDLLFAGRDIEFSYRVESSRTAGCHTRICLTTPRSRFEHLPVPMIGEHQAINLGLALSLLDQLKLKGFEVSEAQAIEAINNIVLPGRLEMVREDPRILLDGAHNAASIQALLRAVSQNIPYDSIVMVFGCAAVKDIPGMMDRIATGADKLIFTRASGNPRAADPQTLASIYEERSGRVAQVTQDLSEALQIAHSAVSREDIICVTGSFYLVGEAKKLLAN
jgi:dihydrofolate synthase/folylpolyglutamate synthase